MIKKLDEIVTNCEVNGKKFKEIMRTVFTSQRLVAGLCSA
jgi:hypothetical protein